MGPTFTVIQDLDETLASVRRYQDKYDFFQELALLLDPHYSLEQVWNLIEEEQGERVPEETQFIFFKHTQIENEAEFLTYVQYCGLEGAFQRAGLPLPEGPTILLCRLTLQGMRNEDNFGIIWGRLDAGRFHSKDVVFLSGQKGYSFLKLQKGHVKKDKIKDFKPNPENTMFLVSLSPFVGLSYEKDFELGPDRKLVCSSLMTRLEPLQVDIQTDFGISRISWNIKDERKTYNCEDSDFRYNKCQWGSTFEIYDSKCKHRVDYHSSPDFFFSDNKHRELKGKICLDFAGEE